ncbi:hypothetical protein EV714DRAFT_275845 [Schizophyllum commune]
MGFFSTLRRTLRRAAQRLGRRQPHELDPHSFVGGDKSAYPSLGWPYLERYSLESSHAVSDDSVDTPGKVPLPSGNSIDGLPTELLSLIFLESAYEPYERPHLGPHFVPFILTHVCTRWRGIAVKMPRLWHRFELRPCVLEGDTRALAETCAKRAKGFGLDISYHELSFNESDGSWYDGTTRLPLDVEFCDCLTEFVIENIGQIRDLDISIGEQSISRFALQVHDPAFALEKLRVTFHCDLPNPGILANLYSGPNLKDLFWNANGGGTNFPRTVECPRDVPWHQLVNLELRACPITQAMFMDLLESASSLQRVATQLHRQISATAQDRRPIRHDALQSLTIQGDGPLDSIFAGFSFPSLRSLVLLCIAPRAAFSAGWPFSKPGLLLQIVEQAQLGLEKLDLNMCGTVDESTLIACLKLPTMSTLLKLSLCAYWPMFTDRFIHLLNPTVNDGLLLPHLEGLVLHHCATRDGVVADMLQARREMAGKLRYILVYYDDDSERHPLDNEMVLQFQDFT